MNRRTAVAGIGTLAVGLGAWRPSPRSREDARRVLQDPELERILRLASVPSLAMASVEGDRVTARAVGVLQRGGAERATPDSLYAAASLTKAVVAYTALALAREGAFSLERPVADYVPLPNADDARAASITARHLLSHTSGWRNWRFAAGQPLVADFTPGARWSYSGEGFFFLQRVLERVTGKAIGALVRERVFAPLDMSRSAMLLAPDPEAPTASGHDGRGEPVADRGRAYRQELARRMLARGDTLDAIRVEDAETTLQTVAPDSPRFPNFLLPNAAASLVTTANDFARFLRHLVTAPQRGGTAAAIVADMFTPQVRCNDAIDWGLGVGLESAGASRSAWQWGDNQGFKNFFFADTASGKAMVVFTNGDRGARVYERVIRASTGTDRAAFLFA